MNYSLITPEILEKRLKSLPSHIQEITTSEQVERLVMQIGRSHYLSRDKVQILQQMVALVLLGIMNLRDLKNELSEKLFLNYTHTVALAHELDEEIFNPIRGDLEQIYTPIEEDVNTEEVGEPEKPISEIKTFVEEDIEPLPENEVGEPVIIHKENKRMKKKELLMEMGQVVEVIMEAGIVLVEVHQDQSLLIAMLL